MDVVIHLVYRFAFLTSLELLHLHDIIICSGFLVHQLLQEASVDCFPGIQ